MARPRPARPAADPVAGPTRRVGIPDLGPRCRPGRRGLRRRRCARDGAGAARRGRRRAGRRSRRGPGGHGQGAGTQQHHAARPPRGAARVPDGEWALTLQTTWVEPAYVEPDASWCLPGGEPATPLANGGAFGGKRAARSRRGPRPWPRERQRPRPGAVEPRGRRPLRAQATTARPRGCGPTVRAWCGSGARRARPIWLTCGNGWPPSPPACRRGGRHRRAAGRGSSSAARGGSRCWRRSTLLQARGAGRARDRGRGPAPAMSRSRAVGGPRSVSSCTGGPAGRGTVRSRYGPAKSSIR